MKFDAGIEIKPAAAPRAPSGPSNRVDGMLARITEVPDGSQIDLQTDPQVAYGLTPLTAFSAAVL